MNFSLSGSFAAMVLAVLSVIFSIHADSFTLSAKVSTNYPQYGAWYLAKSGSMFASMWIMDAGNKFVRTFGSWGGRGSETRPKWNKVNTGTIDGYSGATIHMPTSRTDTMLTATWSLKNLSNAVVPNGDYRFYIEYSNQQYQGPWMCGKITFDGKDKVVTEIDSSGTGKAGVLAGTYITGFKGTYKAIPSSTLFRGNSVIKTADGFITPSGFSGRAQVSGIGLNGRTLWTETVSATPGSIISTRLLKTRHAFAGICFLRATYGNITRTELAGM